MQYKTLKDFLLVVRYYYWPIICIYLFFNVVLYIYIRERERAMSQHKRTDINFQDRDIIDASFDDEGDIRLEIGDDYFYIRLYEMKQLVQLAQVHKMELLLKGQ